MQVSPSVQNENSVSVVTKTVWVKAPHKNPVGESPSINTWPTRPPSWVNITTRPPGHNALIRDLSHLKTYSIALPGLKVLTQAHTIKTQWVEGPQNSLWAKAKLSSVTLSGESGNQQFYSHKCINSTLSPPTPLWSTDTLTNQEPTDYSVDPTSETAVDLLAVKSPDEKYQEYVRYLNKYTAYRNKCIFDHPYGPPRSARGPSANQST